MLGEKEHAEFVRSSVELDTRRAAAGIARFQAGRRYERRQAVSLFEKAGLYDPASDALIPQLLEKDVERFAIWTMVVNAARQP